MNTPHIQFSAMQTQAARAASFFKGQEKGIEDSTDAQEKRRARQSDLLVKNQLRQNQKTQQSEKGTLA